MPAVPGAARSVLHRGALPGRLAGARRCGARRRERARCPGGGVAASPARAAAAPVSAALRAGRLRRAGGGRRIPAPGAAGTAAGMSGASPAPGRT